MTDYIKVKMARNTFENLMKRSEKLKEYEAIGTVEQIQFMKSVCDMSDDMLKSIADSVRARMKYEAIGSVDEFKALKEKSEPKKLNGISRVGGDYFGSCPICNRSAMSCLNIPYKYCPKCGQALDWSE